MSNFIFSDLHLHSIFSDEDLCDETPEHILNKVQEYVTKFNQLNGCEKECVVSITDHNSTLGSFYAHQLIEKEKKFPNVKFVSGVEFTIDLCEMNKGFKHQDVYTRCHLLGYNYNVKNKELLAYSKLTHMTFSKEDNIGLQICSARRAINEMYNINVPFSALLSLTKLKKSANFQVEFANAIKDYFQKINKLYDADVIKRIASEHIMFSPIYEKKAGINVCISTVKYSSEATAYGRLKLSEAVHLIKKAGGKVVFAHPSMTKVSLGGCREILDYPGKLQELFIKEDSEHSNGEHVEISTLKPEYAEEILLDFIERAEGVCGYKIDGLETYHPNSFLNRADKIIRKIAHEREMIETGGSDYHGENFATHKTIGNNFPQFIQRAYGIENNVDQTRQLFIRIVGLPAIGQFLGEEQEFTIVDQNLNELSWKSIDAFLDKAFVTDYKYEKTNSPAEDSSKKTFLTKTKLEIQNCIQSLENIAERYNAILDPSITSKKRRRLLMHLEQFTQASFTSLKRIQNQLRNSPDIFTSDEQKRIVTLIKEIHRKFNEMTRLDTCVIKEVKKELKKKYGSSDFYSEKLASITIRETGDEGRQ